MLDAAGEVVDQVGVGRRERLHVGGQTVGIGIDNQSLSVCAMHPQHLVVVDERPVRNAELLPQLIERRARSRAEQVVDTAVEDVTLPLPGHAQPAGQIVQLEDLGTVAVHLTIDARCQPCNSGADDDD